VPVPQIVSLSTHLFQTLLFTPPDCASETNGDGACFLFLSRSNPGTPTQPRRPDFIGVGSENPLGNHQQHLYMQQPPPQPPPQQYYDFQPRVHHRPPMMVSNGTTGNMSPQRRFLSEGELVRQTAGEFTLYSRAGATADNIRELAGSPQRGVYTWKDTSPGPYPGSSESPTGYEYVTHRPPPAHRTPSHEYHRSTPASPTQTFSTPRPTYYHQLPGAAQAAAAAQAHAQARQQQQQQYPPTSPQLKRKNMATPPSAEMLHCRPSPGSRRPMSFVRALEMSDSMEMNARSPPSGALANSTSPQDTPDRGSVYDMSYEISV